MEYKRTRCTNVECLGIVEAERASIVNPYISHSVSFVIKSLLRIQICKVMDKVSFVLLYDL